MGKDLLECDNLLLVLMSPVIDRDVEGRNFLFEAGPELTIRLVASEYFDLIILIYFAIRIAVNTVDPAFWPEISLPHLQTPPSINPDLEDVDFLPDELGEVSIIYLKIVLKFPEDPPIRV
jgi:hypothetical protein